jgi:alcohol dehydrogenase YqhD (iron-dependent ADH family)
MEDFVFHARTKIIFGRNTEVQTGASIKPFIGDKKVLLHYGQGSIVRSGLYDRVVDSLKAEGIEFVELGGVVPNPRLALVREGIEMCRSQDIGFILAVGGGSVIDSAKAIAIGACAGDDFWERHYVSDEPVIEAIPIGTVLTIPAAGSEASPGTVVTDEPNERKLYAVSAEVVPMVSILNPELTLTLPADQTAYGASDMLAHIMERYFTNTEHVEVTDCLCEGAMRAIIKIAPLVLAEPDNYDYRAEIMLAGMVAHNDSLGIGRIGDWMTHDIEHELSAIWDIAHGAGLAVMFPAWMQHVHRSNIPRFVRFAENVFDVREGSDEEKIQKAIDALRAWYQSIGLCTSLRELEAVEQDKFELMAERCVGDGARGGIMQLTKNDIAEIYRIAWQ